MIKSKYSLCAETKSGSRLDIVSPTKQAGICRTKKTSDPTWDGGRFAVTQMVRGITSIAMAFSNDFLKSLLGISLAYGSTYSIGAGRRIAEAALSMPFLLNLGASKHFEACPSLLTAVLFYFETDCFAYFHNLPSGKLFRRTL
jgi:hypothetical protein